MGALAKEPLFSVNMPVTLADGRKLILNMSAPAATLQPLLEQLGLSQHWEAAIADRGGRIVARSKQLESFLGKTPTPDTLWPTVAPEGVRKTADPGQERVLRAHATSHVSGWKVAVWVPTSVIDASYNRSLSLLVLGGAGLLALSVLLAAAFGQMMAG